MIGVLLLLATVGLTVVGQLLFKWRIDEAGEVPAGAGEKLGFALGLAGDPWVIASFVAALVASVTYGAALTRFDLGFAYPFMSLSFVLVLLFSATFFGEPLTTAKVAGVLLIVLGVFVGTRS
jgi:multidrug transporter EmrE-like cation transporter